MLPKNKKGRNFTHSLIITLLISLSISIPVSLIKYKPVTSQGHLTIHKKNKTEKKLFVKSIETIQWIAEQNFIYKTSMPDTCAMLFLYEHEAAYPFHIKKNHLPCDIIFIAPNYRIVIIEKMFRLLQCRYPTITT